MRCWKVSAPHSAWYLRSLQKKGSFSITDEEGHGVGSGLWGRRSRATHEESL